MAVALTTDSGKTSKPPRQASIAHISTQPLRMEEITLHHLIELISEVLTISAAQLVNE